MRWCSVPKSLGRLRSRRDDHPTALWSLLNHVGYVSNYRLLRLCFVFCRQQKWQFRLWLPLTVGVNFSSCTSPIKPHKRRPWLAGFQLNKVGLCFSKILVGSKTIKYCRPPWQDLQQILPNRSLSAGAILLLQLMWGVITVQGVSKTIYYFYMKSWIGNFFLIICKGEIILLKEIEIVSHLCDLFYAVWNCSCGLGGWKVFRFLVV